MSIIREYNVWRYIQNRCAKLQGDSFQLKKQYIKKIPIPQASEIERRRYLNWYENV